MWKLQCLEYQKDTNKYSLGDCYSMNEKEIQEKVNNISKDLVNSEKKIELLYQRAELYTKLQQHAKAINDYIAIIDIDSTYKDSKVKLDMLRTIVKYVNIDIYASTNTNMDPWMD